MSVKQKSKRKYQISITNMEVLLDIEPFRSTFLEKEFLLVKQPLINIWIRNCSFFRLQEKRNLTTKKALHIWKMSYSQHYRQTYHQRFSKKNITKGFGITAGNRYQSIDLSALLSYRGRIIFINWRFCVCAIQSCTSAFL